MELRSLQCPTVSSIPRGGLNDKTFLSGNTTVKLNSSNTKCTNGRKMKFRDFKPQLASGTNGFKLEAKIASSGDVRQKDENLVFVAGATGKVGSRTVRELLKLGFNVRAGVRSIQRAESLVQSVKNLKLEDVAGDTQPIDKLELVECDLEKLDRIKPAIGNSSVVICCIGASEKEISDITGPYRIDYQATKNLVDAATSAKVDHFILVTSLGTNKVGWPAAILNLFWGVLIWKRKAEEALLASGLPYTIVRPGGMERPTDAYKLTHNITLSEEDTLFGGQVSNLQVAELLAFMAKNKSLSCCKVLEVIAETSAPLTPFGELLEKIPSQREQVNCAKGSDDANKPEPDVPELEKEPSVPELEKAKPTATAPLSPYAAYEDLKPPTSPTPTPSGSKEKPFTSPTVIEVAPQLGEEIASTVIEVAPQLGEGNDVAKSETIENLTSKHSPYLAYDDLKPPSSPSPNVPKLSDNNKPGIPDDVVEHVPISKPRPLSPYAMYDDLKPPSSPLPSPKKMY